MFISANALRREKVAELVKQTEIKIRCWDSPAFTDENWSILAEVIRTTTSLETLSFKFRNAIIALGSDKVVDALAKNRTIKSLDLRKESVGDEGAKVVAAILKENSAIEFVRLGMNMISGEGAKAIADALKKNKTVRHISLSGNNIGVEGAKAIADSLKHNKTLQHIGLSSNGIGDEGAKAIAEALMENTSYKRYILNATLLVKREERIS
jgi:Ran GTPase-activating protein (RanGAP) involved in mRNA processing and transport